MKRSIVWRIKEKPAVITLADEFYSGVKSDIDATVHMLYGDSESNDIVSQYVGFAKVVTEQVRLHGYTQESMTETIRICKDRDLLKDFLERREVEVMDTMTFLFDQKRQISLLLSDVRNDEKIATARRMLSRGKAIKEIAEDIDMPASEILKIRDEMKLTAV